MTCAMLMFHKTHQNKHSCQTACSKGGEIIPVNTRFYYDTFSDTD